jgi:hypothetical protein
VPKRLAPLITIGTAALLLTACGVDSGADGPTPMPRATPTDMPTATPMIQLDVVCVATKAYAVEHIVVVIGKDPVPTAYDAINSGSCEFSEAIVLVQITLRNESGGQMAEIVLPLGTTQLTVPFADVTGLPVIDGELAPGRYERTVTAYTPDGRLSGAIAGFEPVILVDDADGMQTDLLRAQSRWERSGIQYYTYRGAIQCFCPPAYVAPVDITVVGGAVDKVVYAPGAFTGDVPEQGRLSTIDGLFAILQDAIDEQAVSIRADFHPQLGYPTEAFIDYVANIADEELGFTASDVEPR